VRPAGLSRGTGRLAQYRGRRRCGSRSVCCAPTAGLIGCATATRFRAWLVRIAFRLALDRLRSGKRRELRDTLWSQPEYHPPAANAEDIAASNEFQAHLDNALAELPDKLRLVLLLAAMKGHTIDEIAGILGLSTGTVKSRIFYARRQLAEKLRCHANIIKKR